MTWERGRLVRGKPRIISIVAFNALVTFRRRDVRAPVSVAISKRGFQLLRKTKTGNFIRNLYWCARTLLVTTSPVKYYRGFQARKYGLSEIAGIARIVGIVGIVGIMTPPIRTTRSF